MLIVEVLVEKQDVQEDDRKMKRFYFSEDDLREVSISVYFIRLSFCLPVNLMIKTQKHAGH